MFNWYQLKTLLWRNLLIKKKNLKFTLVELLLPLFILLFIKLENSHDGDIYENRGINKVQSEENPLFDSRRLTFDTVFGFIFPDHFENKKEFLERFKSENIFKNVTYASSQPLEIPTTEQKLKKRKIINSDGEKVESKEMDFSHISLLKNKRSDTSETLQEEPEELEEPDEDDMNILYYKKDINEPLYEYEYTRDYTFPIKEYSNMEEVSADFEELNKKGGPHTIYDLTVIKFEDQYSYTIFFFGSDDTTRKITINDYEYSDNYYLLNRLTYIRYYSVIQALVDKTLISLNNNTSSLELNYFSRIMDRKKIIEKFYRGDSDSNTLFFSLFYYLPCFMNIFILLAEEKETGIRELYLVSGLKKYLFWLSWSIIYFVLIVVYALIVIIFIKIRKILFLTNLGVLFVVYLLYGLSTCFFAFFLSNHINKSLKRTIIILMIMFLSIILYAFYSSIEKYRCIIHGLGLFFPSLTFIDIMKFLIRKNNDMIYIHFLDIFKQGRIRNGLLTFLGTCLLYYLLLNFTNLKHRLSHQYKGKVIHPSNKPEQKERSSYIEEEPLHRKKYFKVKGLNHHYGNFQTLHDIEFSGYEGEILAVIGHNGAGKSTLIKIMTGMLKPSTGEVEYEGELLWDHYRNIYKNFGYCPQADIFDAQLNLVEQIKLYAGIKNIKVDPEQILNEIGLYEKRESTPYTLSGGQRRKLSISLALMGSSKYVFLDEPTTGLDPYSRKKIWELMSRKKENRVIVITTHYMDEADIIADRKMVISKGEIRCLGSSLFLKNAFNLDYCLDVYHSSPDSHEIDDILSKLLPLAEIRKSVKNIQSEKYIISYAIPQHWSGQFSSLFQQLDQLFNEKDHQQSYHSYYLSSPNLDDLLIRIENNYNGPKECDDQGYNSDITEPTLNDNPTDELLEHLTFQDYHEKGHKVDPTDSHSNNNPKRNNNALRKIFLLSLVRIKVIFGDWSILLYTILIPLLVTIAIIFGYRYFVNSVFDPKNIKNLEINMDLYSGIWFMEQNTDTFGNQILNSSSMASKIRDSSINYNQTLSYSALVNPNETTHVNIDEYIGGFKIQRQPNTTPKEHLDLTLYHNDYYMFSLPIAINAIDNAILSYYHSNITITTSYQPLPDEVLSGGGSLEFNNNSANLTIDNSDHSKYLKKINFEYGNIQKTIENFSIIGISFLMSILAVIYAPSIVKDKEDGNFHLLTLTGLKPKWYWCAVILSDIILSVVILLQFLLLALFSDMTVVNTNILWYSILTLVVSLCCCFFYQYSLSFLFNTYATCVKYFTFINTLISFFISIIVLLIYYWKSEQLMVEPWNIYNIILYGLALLHPPSNFLLILLKLSFSSTNHILTNIGKPETFSAFEKSTEYQQLLPTPSSLNDPNFSRSITKAFYQFNAPSFSELTKLNPTILYQTFALILSFVLYLFLFLALQTIRAKALKSNKAWDEKERAQRDKIIQEGPKDVYEEWQNVKTWISSPDLGHSKPEITLTVHQINKDYKKGYRNDVGKNKEEESEENEEKEENESRTHSTDHSNSTIVDHTHPNRAEEEREKEEKDQKSKEIEILTVDESNEALILKTYDDSKVYRAVNDVTFQVKEKECLSILGPNGAGKTTTISMMMGKENITRGEIYFEEKRLHQSCEIETTLSGLCPQFTLLWSSLTVQNILEFYLKISGYSKTESQTKAQDLMKLSGIESYARHRISELSGGTKRKLSLLVSLCSDPHHVVLDEPTSGVDPFTRRFLWNIIKTYKNTNKVVMLLTTHSTEEAEALSDKIAILNKGHLQCIGSPQYLKMLYGKDCVLEIFKVDGKDIDIETTLLNHQILWKPKAYKKEIYLNFERYTFSSDQKHLSTIFNEMEKLKQSGVISDYNFGQCSLEQIFIEKIKE